MSYRTIKFLKSMAWNVGMMSLAFAIDYTAKNLGLFNMSPEVTAFVGICLARCSKIINTEIQFRNENKG